jgi:adenine-specific DNA-methyltransferase
MSLRIFVTRRQFVRIEKENTKAPSPRDRSGLGPLPRGGEGVWEMLELSKRVPQQEFVKQLRREQTDAERKMWSLLRSRSLDGYKFRRQQPIGPYIADFCCFRPRLIVELDGGQHAEQVEYDERRTAFLESEGYQVVRFWDNQVLMEMDAVLEMILKTLTETPSPRGRGGPGPLPRRGEGGSGDTL